MNRTWLELKYGTPKAAITLFRLDDPTLLRAFSKKALKEVRWKAEESRGIDPVLGVIDGFEAQKIERVLDLVIPLVETS